MIDSAKGVVKDSIIVIDRSGSETFQYELKKYLNRRFNNGSKIVKKVKQRDSHKNNLLQVADYFASVSNRKLQGKSLDDYQIISKKNYIKVWPKQSPYSLARK